MSDDSVTTVYGSFMRREEADRAVEHLVQEHHVDRSNIFIQSEEAANTAGSAPSGPDATGGELDGSSYDPAVRGRVLVSVDAAAEQVDTVRETLTNIGAMDVEAR